MLGLVEDAHPDALACRCLVTLAVLRSGCPLPWDFRQEFAWYVLGCPENARWDVIFPLPREGREGLWMQWSTSGPEHMPDGMSDRMSERNTVIN